jgi:cytochrome c-type biogenesis protein CcmE
MTRKGRRLALVGSALAVVAFAVGLVLYGLRDGIALFVVPSEIAERGIGEGQRFRLGGIVREGSIERLPNQTVRFDVTDGRTQVAVTYVGILPDLFREGQGVVTEGRLVAGGQFRADSVLARHDENYMPREVADSLKRQGHWNPASGQAPSPAQVRGGGS